LGAVLYAGAQRARGEPAGGPAAASRGTKVALLNLSYVLRYYEKFKNYQEEVKKVVEPYQKKDREIVNEGERLPKQVKAPATTAEQREVLERKLRQLTRDREDNENAVKKEVARRSGEQIKILYTEIFEVAKRYAGAHGYDAVLQYNDVTEA